MVSLSVTAKEYTGARSKSGKWVSRCKEKGCLNKCNVNLKLCRSELHSTADCITDRPEKAANGLLERRRCFVFALGLPEGARRSWTELGDEQHVAGMSR
ncbi:Hypothetical predicted protein [Podarcis lilfordi]|uniref:Uncharacterized protein n=1 Tax=Podarcis lilfordi TaxID=74358 RepID=A0AA35L711_9SAUR|nr:Hypothetical predicted protein [Podarcis lilfordi]